MVFEDKEEDKDEKLILDPFLTLILSSCSPF